MIDADAQRRILDRILVAAAKRGLRVAPVGSVYFLERGEARVLTKDVDAVVHTDAGGIVSLENLTALGKALGDVEVSDDQTMVTVTIRDEGPEPVVIELLRGRSSPGFLHRDLLLEAARLGETRGNMILYPVEHVITLKAEAALDREDRAKKAEEVAKTDAARRSELLTRAKRNRERAEIFRADVFRQMAAAEDRGYDPARFAQAIVHVKKSWRRQVAALLDAASRGRLALSTQERLF